MMLPQRMLLLLLHCAHVTMGMNSGDSHTTISTIADLDYFTMLLKLSTLQQRRRRHAGACRKITYRATREESMLYAVAKLQ
uniref:Putative secreted peptide n=1 Tax=Anopheles braziliensis TaxID=58242 RepID=A0A2M3ZRB4_9DIPT